MIRVRQLEEKDALAATNLWASAMKGSNYGESMQNRIDQFVDTKLKDLNDMGDVYRNYVLQKDNSSNDDILIPESEVNFETNHTAKRKCSFQNRNFWVVEFIPQLSDQGTDI